MELGGDMVALLERHLSRVHGVATINARSGGDDAEVVRAFDPS